MPKNRSKNIPNAAEVSTQSLPRDRWTVIEQFEHEGYRYRFSRRPVGPSGEVVRLTAREMQAVAYAKQGYNNKLIARALGVAPSTVGVLLYRAAAKVGARTRGELLSAYTRLERDEE